MACFVGNAPAAETYSEHAERGDDGTVLGGGNSRVGGGEEALRSLAGGTGCALGRHDFELLLSRTAGRRWETVCGMGKGKRMRSGSCGRADA